MTPTQMSLVLVLRIDLKKIPQVVALAYHEDKWSGVYYSCINHLITDLITTDVIAKQILKAEL